MARVKYIWQSDGGENMCDYCAALDGTRYYSAEEVPSKPHPNCKCVVEDISGFRPKILTPSPWPGKDVEKDAKGRPIYISPDGTRETHPPIHPFFSHEAREKREWEKIKEKERAKTHRSTYKNTEKLVFAQMAPIEEIERKKLINMVFENAKNHNFLSEVERRKALTEGKNLRLEIKDNPSANRDIVSYEKPELGLQAIDKYSNLIDNLSKRYQLDSDIVKAVLYIESATGHKYGLNDIAAILSA